METSSFIATYFYPYINFLIFLGILWVFARKPLNQMAENRLHEFKSQAEKAQKAKKIAEEDLAVAKAELKSLGKELETLKLETAKELAEEKEKIIHQAEALAKQWVADAKRQIAEEVDQARITLEKELLAKAKEKAKDQLNSQFGVKEKEKYFQNQLERLKA